MLKSHWFETCREKTSNHVKGWCGSRRVRSSGDFDGLDAPELWFLKPQVNPDTNTFGHINKQKKNMKQKVWKWYVIG